MLVEVWCFFFVHGAQCRAAAVVINVVQMLAEQQCEFGFICVHTNNVEQFASDLTRADCSRPCVMPQSHCAPARAWMGVFVRELRRVFAARRAYTHLSPLPSTNGSAKFNSEY